MKNKSLKHVSVKSLLQRVQEKLRFSSAVWLKHHPKQAVKNGINLVDCLMSGLAVFHLKYPSLLKFDEEARQQHVRHNLKRLYGVEHAPSDTYLRERLDPIDPDVTRRAYKGVLYEVQRAKLLERYAYWQGHYLLSVDGTGHFYSDKVHCQHCCEKHHANGSVSYYHQALSGAIVHPDESVVFPLAPEPILKADGQSKNDCELNAAKRLLPAVRQDHPYLKLIVVMDALYANGPLLALLESLNLRFIINAKPKALPFLFDWVNATVCDTGCWQDRRGYRYEYRYACDVPLNDTHYEREVNFVEVWERDPKGKLKHFSWITDLPTSHETVALIMRGGRARWRIENETFNTLKNQGYHFEHNYGHGYDQLSTVLLRLMMLAFLIDQASLLGDVLFKRLKAQERTWYSLWEKLRTAFDLWLWEAWEDLFHLLLKDHIPLQWERAPPVIA